MCELLNVSNTRGSYQIPARGTVGPQKVILVNASKIRSFLYKCYTLFYVMCIYSIRLFAMYNNYSPFSKIFLNGFKDSPLIKFHDYECWTWFRTIYTAIFRAFNVISIQVTQWIHLGVDHSHQNVENWKIFFLISLCFFVHFFKINNIANAKNTLQVRLFNVSFSFLYFFFYLSLT